MSAKRKKTGLLARKLGMTQVFTGEYGEAKGVTVLEVGPCTVTQVKTKATDGYDAIQLGFGEIDFRKLSRAERGHLEKKKLRAFSELREFTVAHPKKFHVGQVLTVNAFQEGDLVDAVGISKGKGFQGVIKRHGKSGGPASHGSRFHRTTGSIGQRAFPGKVFKLMKLPGHMGDRRVTVRNLEVVRIDSERNLLVLHGAVPGAESSIVSIRGVKTDFETRLYPKEPEKKEEVKQEDSVAV